MQNNNLLTQAELFGPIYYDFRAALTTTAPRSSLNNGDYFNKDVVLYSLLAKIAKDKNASYINDVLTSQTGFSIIKASPTGSRKR